MPPDPPAPTPAITDMLAGCCGGREAAERVYPLLYGELRRLAQHHLGGERPGHTLKATALVHEAYFRLAGLRDQQFRSRAHFMAVASSMIRRILVDHARRRRAQKRGGDAAPVTVTASLAAAPPEASRVDLLALDEALEILGRMDARQVQIVELRFFGGLTVDQVAEVLDVSPRTVKTDWQIAKAWLFDRLRPAE